MLRAASSAARSSSRLGISPRISSGGTSVPSGTSGASTVAPRYSAACLTTLDNSNGKMIFVAWPSAIFFKASRESTVIARRSSGREPTERMRSPCASPCACRIFDSRSPSARRILLCRSPSASRMMLCRLPSALRIADRFSPSARRIAARRSRSAAVCSVIACLTAPAGSTSLISTRSTFTPQASVSRSRISRRRALMTSRL